jgi:hypothetical protein
MWYLAKTMITYLYNRFLQPVGGEKTFARLLPKLIFVWLPLLAMLLYVLIKYL